MRSKTRNRQMHDSGGAGYIRGASSFRCLMLIGTAIMLGVKQTLAGDPIILPALEGIGYYEMVPKVGVNGASFAGGTEIVIYGQGMSHTPTSITAIFSNNQLGQNSGGPPKPQDVAFSSHTDGGKLKYTTPPIMQIHNARYEDFSDLETVTYDLSMLDYDDMTQWLKTLKCMHPALPQWCQITYSRAYTPILHYLSPRVVYSGSQIGFFIDPRNAQEKRSPSLPELPWTDVHLDGYGVDFEGFIEENTNIPAWQKVQVRGVMGAIEPSKEVSVEFKFRVGYAMHMEHSMIRCSFDNSTCYKAKAVARIDSIDATTGYTTGGQLLTIKGHGFNADLHEVKIDGVPCKVTEFDLNYIKCLTGANPTPSSDVSYLGQHGLKRRYYNSSQVLTPSNILQSNDFTESLALELEAPKDARDYYSGYIFQGYFKAPSTAQYRFYIAQDDEAEVYFSNVDMSPQNKSLLYKSTSWTGYRDYLKIDSSRQTKWLNLTKGEAYYLEVRMVQYTGGDHLSVAVEIQDPNITPGHFHTMREVQRLMIDQIITRETTNITILNPDDGIFALGFVDPKTGTNYVGAKMSTNCSGWEMNVAIRDFYRKVYSAGISVTKTMYNADGAVTNNVRNHTKAVFSIQVMRSLNKVTTNKINVQKITLSSEATITVTYPTDIQLSNQVMTGSFRIKCALDKDGTNWNTTYDLFTTNNTNQIYNAIIRTCPLYREKIEIWDGPKYPYYDDGRDLMIRYVGLNYDIPQMEVLDGFTTQVSGNGASFNSTTWIDWDPTRIFYEPVPFEFLHTEESDPQVLVQVDGIEAVCASLNCGYRYKSPTAKITNVQLSGTSLTITGTSLPSSVKTVEFSHVQCGDITVSSDGTTLKCTIVPVAGSWLPIVTDEFGIIPIDNDVSPISVPFTLTNVSPNVDLNPYGGTFLVIKGTALPQSLTEGSTCSITFSDGSTCELVALQGTSLTCMTSGFTSGTTSATVIVTVNGNSQTFSQALPVKTDPSKVSQISPSSISPVLKKPIKITISGYSDALVQSDLEVNIISKGVNPPIIRPMNVLEVGAVDGTTDQYLTAMFGGSESGVYDLQVRSRSYGKFDTTGITLTLVGKVTDFNPKQGSIHGGTLITIDGYHFSQDKQDNPVRIGLTDCLVEETSATQIKCRTVARKEDQIGVDDLIVFLRTFEEAVCGETITKCKFTWIDDAQITSYSTAFDSATGTYLLSFLGQSFGGADLTASQVEVHIDNQKQEVVSVDSGSLSVRIVHMKGSTTTDIDIYLPSGQPGTDLTDLITVGITLDPKFLGFQPKIGSIGGTQIVAQVQGLGPASTGATLVTADGVDICQSASIPKYGQLLCMTKAGITFTETNILSLSVNGAPIPCIPVSADGNCEYNAGPSYNFPVVSGVANVDGSTIQLMGSGFKELVDGLSGKVTYNNVAASAVTVISDNSLSAYFASGVPLSTASQTVNLSFKDDTTQVLHQAVSVNMTNAPTITQIDSNVTCSFAGGCQLSLTQPGLLANLQADPVLNNIRVCGQLCKADLVSSSAGQVLCTVPPLPTSSSIDQFKIISESYVKGVAFSSKPLDSVLTNSVWDGSHQKGWTDLSTPCFFGTAFRVGYVGVLNEVKYFMARFKKSNYVGTLRFEASMTGATGTWTTIFTVGEEIHEGWNYYNFASGKEIKYRYYRFYGTSTGSCIVGEVSLRGYEAIDSVESTQTCQASVTINGASTALQLQGDIQYQASLTPLLQSIYPRFGTVVGRELITFNGQIFSPVKEDYTVLLDNRPCIVEEATTTYFKCRTASRPGLFPNPSTEIRIAGMGRVSTQGLIFRYVNYWSELKTWGGDFPPVDGDLISIPKGLNLLVDIDSTPILSAVIVEGALIFPSNPNPKHLRTFDAHYVMVRGGLLEVGTEQFPYTSQLIITMHSNRSSPELPIFGNKVIAMYGGTLDLHGIPRTPTWTELDVTAEIGSKTLTLIRDVDWQVGESIVIAPTGYFNTEAEERVIVAIDNTNPNKPIITIDEPLQYKHYAGIQYFGANRQDWIETRAEVGLLTRNVLYRGDPATSARNEYGAQIMVHSNGMENLVARIEYIHFFNVGQGFQLGRYPIHFHLIGVVHNSYIKGNAIQQSFNRACTIHGVHYLRITENVAYNIKGHTFFIEDAAETHNYLDRNLAILTKRSWSLLNSDQTPASFWITNPDNIFTNNHAAGSDNYGYWFDTKPNPTGPSFDPNICPENSPLGEFSNNVAHSNGRYGLRIFHKLIPRTFPCMDIIDDATNINDPYWKNPLIPAVFQNFTSYKNRRNGAIALDIGAVRFENFKVSDNLLAGIEVELTKNVRDGLARIQGALIIGHSELAEELTFTNFKHERPSYGVIGPRTEGFQVHDVRFYNFDVSQKAAISTCSHCFSAPSTDSGARTLTVNNLKFDSSTTARVHYQVPFREIIKDLDGSLTGLGANSWATAYWKHNEVPECQVKLDLYDGLICNPTVQVRRIVYHNQVPSYIFQAMDMKVLRVDDDLVGKMDNETYNNYLLDPASYSIFDFRPKTDPVNAWAIPIVTGHKYKVHWQYGLDFEKMQVTLSPHWAPTDKSIYMIHNFTDVRAKVDFIMPTKDIVPNMTLVNKTAALWQTGDNVLYNQTSRREIHYVINGKNATRTQLVMSGSRCIGACLVAIAQQVIETTEKLWSDPTTWASGKVPAGGEDVEVPAGKNIVFDLEESPIFNYVQINGRLTFKQDKAKLHLRSKYIFVRMGELFIGNETNPFPGEAKITLFGLKQDMHIVYDNAIEAGNKILANTGIMKIYGQPRIIRSRLLQTALSGASTIFVEAGLSWAANDILALPSTTMKWFEKDLVKVKSYNNQTGEITLWEPLNNYHWGAPVSTAADYSGVDMRGEVMLMTRNVKIQGENVDGWGCQILTSDFIEANLEARVGRTFIDNVEIYNCSQYDTWKAALRFQGSKLGYSRVSNSAIYYGMGMGLEIMFAENVEIVNNNFYEFVKYGLNIVTSNNITIDGNWIAGIIWRQVESGTVGDPTAGLVGCGHIPSDECIGLKIINNVVASVEKAGVDTTGYTVMNYQCGRPETNLFYDNIAHSIHGYGAIIFRNETLIDHGTCIQASRFTAYKCQLAGVVSNQATHNLILQDMIMIDNRHSVVGMVGLEGTNQSVTVRNVKFYGETQASECPGKPNICNENWQDDGCFDRSALMASSFAGHNKPALVIFKPTWPQFKIKADASFGGSTTYENLEFYNFRSGFTSCGTMQRIMVLNGYNADYYPPMRVINPRFVNVAQDSMVYLMDPPDGWANIDDCGQFPCTSPNNVLIQYEKATFSGQILPVRQDPTFQIISGLDQNSGAFISCSKVTQWNAYYCLNEDLAMVLFESLDEDKLTRLVSPITITNEVLKSRNILNTFMDHLWDGFYTSMKRLSRFPALILAGNGYVYEINYKGTPPLRQRFILRSNQAATTIRIKYPKAGAYQIQDAQGRNINANPWDNSIQAPAIIKGDKGGFCGENRYVGVVNILEFYLTKNCIIFIQPIDSIQASVRMNWTMNQFFADGGTTRFADRVAASLGIKVANVKIVSVYQGSVVVDFSVVEDTLKTLSSKGGIDQVQNQLTTKLASKSMNLGAPILNVAVSATKATDVTATAAAATATKTAASMNMFNPTNPIVQNAPVEKTTIVLPTTTTVKPLVQPIYNSTTINVVKHEDLTPQNTLMAAVIGSIIGVITLGGIIGYFVYRRYAFKMIAQKSQATMNNEHGHAAVDQTSKAGITHGSPEILGDDVFEEQYHPSSAVIDIFGRGNDIIKKANMADAVEEIKEDFEEDESSQQESAVENHGPDSPGRGGSGGSGAYTHTTRGLITAQRDSILTDNVPPLGTFDSHQHALNVRLGRVPAGASATAQPDYSTAGYNSASRYASNGAAGRAPPTFNE